MARSHGRIKVEIWSDEDFRSLTKDAQRGYLLLLSQPQINNCGVLSYTPRKWTKLALDESLEELEWMLAELHGRRFILVDEEAEEILVRTFVRHDRIKDQPNLVKAAQKEFLTIESQRIREVLAVEHPDIFGGLEKGVSEGVSEGVQFKGVSEGVFDAGKNPSTRARRALPAPSPKSSPLLESVSSEVQSVERDALSGGDSLHKDRDEDEDDVAGSLALAGSRSPAPRITGWTWKRGSHGEAWVRDPEGVDKPPSSVVSDWKERGEHREREHVELVDVDPDGIRRIAELQHEAWAKAIEERKQEGIIDEDDPEVQRKRDASKTALERIQREEDEGARG